MSVHYSVQTFHPMLFSDVYGVVTDGSGWEYVRLRSGVRCRYMSALKTQRVAAEKFYADLGLGGIQPGKVDKAQLISDVKDALYSAKICSYAQV